LSGSETHHLSGMPPPRRWVSLCSTHPTGFDVERMAPPNIAERLAQEIDAIDEKTQAALSQGWP